MRRAMSRFPGLINLNDDTDPAQGITNMATIRRVFRRGR